MGLLLSLTSQPLLVSGRFLGKWLRAWVRLGPLSMGGSFRSHSHRRLTTRSRHRSPNRAAWRFPDWTAVGFRFKRGLRAFLLWAFLPETRALFRGPFLGSAASSPGITAGS